MNQASYVQIMSEDYADFIFMNDQIPDSFKSMPGSSYQVINNLHTVVYAPTANLPKNILTEYSYSILPSCYGMMNLDSFESTGVSQVQDSSLLNLTGKGVLIGMLDTGIDYTHEAFKKSDGTSKIISIWDQTINEGGSYPPELNYGTEYVKEQIDAAIASSNPLSIVPSMDYNGHGTYLAGMAAGSRKEEEKFSGTAPDAEIIVVKLKPAKQYIKDFFLVPMDAECYQENDIMFAIKYILDIANKLRRPLSLCIGIGTSQRLNDARSALSKYLSRIAELRGIGITIAAGNEGDTKHHYSGTVDNNSSYDTVELMVGSNNKGFSMELWGNSPNIFSIDIQSPSGQYVPRIPASLKETREIEFLFDGTMLYLDYELLEEQTGSELILLRLENPSEGTWRFRVYASNNIEPFFNIWLPISDFLNEDTFFKKPDPNYTLTAPGNSHIPIVVTAYDYITQNLYQSASRGYTISNIVNPSFAAPGVQMIVPALGNNYIAVSGTSISAAFTAGVVAMLLEWAVINGNQPQFDTLQMKNFFIRGAKREELIIYPNKAWGYGIIDVYQSFSSLRN